LSILAFLTSQLVPLARQLTNDVATISQLTRNVPTPDNNEGRGTLSFQSTGTVSANFTELLGNEESMDVDTVDVDTVDVNTNETIASSTVTNSTSLAEAASITSATIEETTESMKLSRAIIDTAIVNVRSAPSVAGELLTQLRKDQEVEIMGTSNDEQWYKICCPLGTNAVRETWVSAAFVQIVEPAHPPLTLASATTPITTAQPISLRSTSKQNGQLQQHGVVNGSLVNIRQGPGTDYAVVGQVTKSTTMIVTGRTEQKDWLQFCCLNSSLDEGWISAGFVDLAQDNQSEHAALLSALPISPTPIPPTATPQPAASVIPTTAAGDMLGKAVAQANISVGSPN